MQQNIPLVHAACVNKHGARFKSSTKIFSDMTVTIPTDRICGILGHAGSGRTTFLRLLNGTERPNSGHILSTSQFSIICNAGSFFQSSMTGLDNITLAARLYGMPAAMLTEMTLAIADFGSDWQVLAGSLPGPRRKAMEMLVAAFLPYDCYLVDDVERVDPDILAIILELLRLRKAGMIFTAKNPKLVREIATCCSVIMHQTVYAFESVDEALKHYV